MKKFTLILLLSNGFILYSQQHLIQVNRKQNSPEEVSISINPVIPGQVAASSNIANYYYSTNGGKTWREKTMESKHGIWGDPVVHFDSQGKLYYCHLGKNAEKKYPKWIDKIVVQRTSLNNDTCFEDNSIGFNQGKVQDKEWLSSNADGTLYMTWTEFDNYNSKKPEDHSRIRFSKSTNHGKTWNTPLVISDTEGDCQDGDNTLEGATTCSDSKGNIYACWGGLNAIWLDKSTDGGRSFGKDKIVANQDAGWDIPIRNLYRSNGMPFICCDAFGSKFKDRVYINWCDTRYGDADVFIKYSDDGGINWSQDIRINDDQIKNGVAQFSNNICIDASNGNLYVVFYDQRNSSSGAFIDVYLALSKNGGATWENHRITPSCFSTPGSKEFFGDYIDVDAVNGNVMPIFTIYENKTLAVYTCTFNSTPPKKTKLKNQLLAKIANDSLYLHVAVNKNESYELLFYANGRKLKYNGNKKENDYVINARGFYNATVTLKVGMRRRTIHLINNK